MDQPHYSTHLLGLVAFYDPSSRLQDIVRRSRVLYFRQAMVRSLVASVQNMGCRTKVKTGCKTCRIRRVKCDENKPFCHECVKTGRICDGYQSPFRILSSQAANKFHAGETKLDNTLRPLQPPLLHITPKDIELLNRYFSTKTIFNVPLGCDEEARQVLQLSLTDPPTRHVVLSLKALREDLETSGDDPASVAQQTAKYNHGLQQYSTALRGLAANLSSPGPDRLKSALICCQVLISIEQVQKNYAAMALHIIRGLRIMHVYRARPSLVAADKLMPAYHGELPFLDIFIIKLFAAPCHFAETAITANTSVVMSMGLASSHQRPTVSRDLRTIAPNTRAQLVKISASILEFLVSVSRVESVGAALRLLSNKTALLDSLESWLKHLEHGQTEVEPPCLEPISVSFMRCFYLILKIVLLGALESSPDLDVKLRLETDRLQCVANNVGERVRTYRTCRGTSHGCGE